MKNKYEYEIPDFGFQDNSLLEEIGGMNEAIAKSSYWSIFYDAISNEPKFEKLQRFIKYQKEKRLQNAARNQKAQKKIKRQDSSNRVTKSVKFSNELETEKLTTQEA